MTNSDLLKEKIAEAGFKLSFIARQLSISYACLFKKINNETEFKASEISKLSDLLQLDYAERESIFFA